MLETIFGMMYRQADGRNGRPMQWNAYLYIGLAYICYDQFPHSGNMVAFSVYAITLINILSGYKSFTLPWVVYLYEYHLKFKKMERNAVIVDMEKRCEISYCIYREDIKSSYKKNNGFDTWHTCYRFLIPSAIIVFIIDGFSIQLTSLYWLCSTVIAGALFPLSVRALEYVPQDKRDYYGELFANVREAILGGVLIGGLVWL